MRTTKIWCLLFALTLPNAASAGLFFNSYKVSGFNCHSADRAFSFKVESKTLNSGIDYVAPTTTGELKNNLTRETLSHFEISAEDGDQASTDLGKRLSYYFSNNGRQVTVVYRKAYDDVKMIDMSCRTYGDDKIDSKPLDFSVKLNINENMFGASSRSFVHGEFAETDIFTSDNPLFKVYTPGQIFSVCSIGREVFNENNSAHSDQVQLTNITGKGSDTIDLSGLGKNAFVYVSCLKYRKDEHGTTRLIKNPSISAAEAASMLREALPPGTVELN